jgi:2-amino-4-hydroxy-6-hydroxymethyldihydropteridine diphosphokinase
MRRPEPQQALGNAIILLGSNIEPEKNIRVGAEKLAQHFSMRQSSSVWITPAVGTSGPDFYNAAVMCSTDLTAEAVKYSVLRPIEEQMGRVRTSDKYAPRTMDLDVIILNGIVLESRLWDTAFILLPVAELIPDWQSPFSRKRLKGLADEILPASGARPLPDFPLFVTKP